MSAVGASLFQGVESREVAGVDFRLFAVVPYQCVSLPPPHWSLPPMYQGRELHRLQARAEYF